MTLHEKLQLWTSPGVFGFYHSCQATLCCLLDHDNTAYNFFTLVTFESRKMASDSSSPYLTNRNERFGNGLRLIVAQYQIPIEEAIDLCKQLTSGTDQIQTALGSLRLPPLTPLPSNFVPSDSTVTIPANKLLKNNFHGGSMILEWFGAKDTISALLTDTDIQRVALRIRELVSVDLFTISDRIGNIIFQIPSQLAYSSLTGSAEEMTCTITFDERVENMEKYILTIKTDLDRSLVDFHADRCTNDHSLTLSLAETGGPYVITLMDTEHHIPVFQETTSMMRSVRNTLTIYGNEDSVRTISLPNVPATHVVINSSQQISVGADELPWKAASMQRRYQQRMEELSHSKEFVRYGKCGNDRERALRDLRSLMNVQPDTRVCLWDPYLTANDLLETWYYTDTYGLELRAITSNTIAQNKKITLDDWKEEQRAALKKGSNQFGINLSWRIQHSMFGFPFHDRFLILIPADSAPKVWSLGTSVNSFGKTHHILQLVSNPGYIVDDFEALWNLLSDSSCQIWNSKEDA